MILQIYPREKFAFFEYKNESGGNHAIYNFSNKLKMSNLLSSEKNF